MGYQRFYPQQNEPSGSGSFWAGLGIGVFLGAVLGLLSAPHRGDVTRRKIVRQADATRDQVVEAVEDFVERRAGSEDGDNCEA
jgi:gas vesicle protein